MRCFIGIPIPENLKRKITELQKQFENFDIKFVETENLHFNFKFLGEISDPEFEKTKDILQEVSKQFKPFEIDITSLGVFPSKNYIRVIWIGVREGFQNLVALANVIDDSLAEIVPKEPKKFQPHLTLGRVKSPGNKAELISTIQRHENIEIGKMKIDRTVLFESRLSPSGPVYSEIFSKSFNHLL